MDNKTVYVQIIKDATNECSWQSGPVSERQAERMQRGASINLNHDEFSVVISETRREDAKR